MLEFEKIFKKHDNRLKNLNLKVKDAMEDRRANRMIHKSRSRRRSASRNDNKQSSNSSV